MQQVYHQTEPPQSPESNVSTNLLPIVNSCNSDYTKINVLSSKPDYYPVCVNYFAPSNRYTRCHWIDKLGFPYKVMMMKYPYGIRLGTPTFIWRASEEADETRNSRVLLQVTKEIAKYSTREMRRNFIEKYQHFTTSKSILQSIFVI